MSEQVATAAAADIAADALARDRAIRSAPLRLTPGPRWIRQNNRSNRAPASTPVRGRSARGNSRYHFHPEAAAEMRARVLKALRGEIDCDRALKAARMRKFADAALARASARGWDLAQDPGRLRIQTIDSFNFRLATQLTVTAKAGGSLLITERPHELYNRAARQTLAAADHDDQTRGGH